MQRLYKYAYAFAPALWGITSGDEEYYYQWTDDEFADQLERYRGYQNDWSYLHHGQIPTFATHDECKKNWT